MKKKFVSIKNFADLSAIRRQINNAFSEKGAEVAKALNDLLTELEGSDVEVNEEELKAKVEEIFKNLMPNTEEVVANALAKKMAEILEQKGAKKVVVSNLVTDDMAEIIEDAFRYDKVILASASYNAEVFPPMEQFLSHLRGKNYQNRKIGLIENGTWAPSAAKCMKEFIDGMKDITLCQKIVTIKSVMNKENISEMEELADEILSK